MEERLLEPGYNGMASPMPKGFWGRDGSDFNCQRSDPQMANAYGHVVSGEEYAIVAAVLRKTSWLPGNDAHGSFAKGFAWHNSGRVDCSAPSKDGHFPAVTTDPESWKCRRGKDVMCLWPIRGKWAAQVEDITTDAVNATPLGKVRITHLQIILRPCYTELDDLCGELWASKRMPMFPVIYIRGEVERDDESECSTSSISALDQAKLARYSEYFFFFPKYRGVIRSAPSKTPWPCVMRSDPPSKTLCRYTLHYFFIH
jgi:hypothetical protein